MMTPIPEEGLGGIKSTFDLNIARARSFIELFEARGTGRDGNQLVSDTDLLRAAVMFIHSSLEEFFRGLESEYWLDYDIDYLNTIPFYIDGRADKKISLGDLFKLGRGRSVDDFVESMVIKDIYARRNITQISHIINAITRLGITHNLEEAECAKLAALLERRHLIVHQADRRSSPEARGSKGKVRSLKTPEVNDWLQSVTELVGAIHSKIALQEQTRQPDP